MHDGFIMSEGRILKKSPIFHVKLTVKQAATILLMTILAFNWLGYRLLSDYLEHRSDIALENKINTDNYDENSLIELRVPLNAPYLNNTTDFERVDGEIELDGIHYKYVKRKVENGELVLMCIPNENKTRILNSRVDFFKMVNDVDQKSDGKSKNTASFKTLTTEYKQENNSWQLAALDLIIRVNKLQSISLTNAGFTAIPEQPPRC